MKCLASSNYLKVANDIAEFAVALIKKFNERVTKDKQIVHNQQKQYPDTNKKTFREKYIKKKQCIFY